MNMQWLREKAPGFKELSEEECRATVEIFILNPE